jgi:hypothetical protein
MAPVFIWPDPLKRILPEFFYSVIYWPFHPDNKLYLTTLPSVSNITVLTDLKGTGS